MNDVFTQIVGGYLSPFVRALGMCLILPLGENWVLKKIGFCVALSFLGGPAILEGLDQGDNYFFLPLDFLIGFALGLPFALVVTGGGMIGALFDTLRGQTMLRIFDPSSATEDSGTEVLCKHVTLTYLVLMGAFEIFIRGYLESLARFPHGTLSSLTLQAVVYRMLLFNSKIMTQLFAVVLPYAVLFLSIELLFGVVTKLLPGMSFQCETFQVKSVLGFALLGAGYSSGTLDLLLRFTSHPELLFRLIDP